MLYLGAFSERERIRDIDAQVPGGALDFRMAKQDPHSAQIARMLVYDRGFGSSQRMCPVVLSPQSDPGHPVATNYAIRTYCRWRPPSQVTDAIRPTACTGRWSGVSLSSARCVRTPLSTATGPAKTERKPAIVTVTSRKRLKMMRQDRAQAAGADADPEVTARVRAWLKQMIRPTGE
jgi:hypothetical protein